MIGIGIRIGHPLPHTFQIRDGRRRLAQTIERQAAHLDGLQISRILGHRRRKGPLRVDQLAAAVIRDAQFAACALHWWLLGCLLLQGGDRSRARGTRGTRSRRRALCQAAQGKHHTPGISAKIRERSFGIAQIKEYAPGPRAPASPTGASICKMAVWYQIAGCDAGGCTGSLSREYGSSTPGMVCRCSRASGRADEQCQR